MTPTSELKEGDVFVEGDGCYVCVAPFSKGPSLSYHYWYAKGKGRDRIPFIGTVTKTLFNRDVSILFNVHDLGKILVERGEDE